jgi:hypothetical protein
MSHRKEQTNFGEKFQIIDGEGWETDSAEGTGIEKFISSN